MFISNFNIIIDRYNLHSVTDYVSTLLVRKHASGMFSYLPFGMQLRKNIESFIIDIQSKFGSEVSTPILESAKIYEVCGRDKVFGMELYTLVNRRGQKLFISPTCEEVFLTYFIEHNRSYKRFPLYLFQVSTKCRDEIRPRNVTSRMCIFTMFDGYSFHIDSSDASLWYEKIRASFSEIFNLLEINTFIISSDPSSMLGKSSEEFFVCSKINEASAVVNINGSDKEIQGIEIAHIFDLGTVYSEKLDKCYIDKFDKKQSIHMCSFGIGIDRVILMCIENLMFHNKVSRLVFKYECCFIPDNLDMSDLIYKMYFELSDDKKAKSMLFDLTNCSFDNKVQLSKYFGVEYIIYRHAQEVICKNFITMQQVDAEQYLFRL